MSNKNLFLSELSSRCYFMMQAASLKEKKERLVYSPYIDVKRYDSCEDGMEECLFDNWLESLSNPMILKEVVEMFHEKYPLSFSRLFDETLNPCCSFLDEFQYKHFMYARIEYGKPSIWHVRGIKDMITPSISYRHCFFHEAHPMLELYWCCTPSRSFRVNDQTLVKFIESKCCATVVNIILDEFESNEKRSSIFSRFMQLVELWPNILECDADNSDRLEKFIHSSIVIQNNRLLNEKELILLKDNYLSWREICCM